MAKISDAHKANFDTLQRAGRENNLAALDCYDTVEKKSVVLVVAMQKQGDEIEMVPLAVMVDCNPYERYAPPKADGEGYEPMEAGL
jgi:hypothetical protein